MAPRFFTNSSSSLMRKKARPTLRRLRLRAHVCARACPCVRRCAVQNRKMRKTQKGCWSLTLPLLLSFTSLLSFSPGSLVAVEPTAAAYRFCSLYFFFFYPLFLLLFFFLHQVSTKLPLFFFSQKNLRKNAPVQLRLSISPSHLESLSVFSVFSHSPPFTVS